MLVRVLKELPEYRNIVVTLQDKNNFGDELQCDEYICLNKPSLLSLPSAVIQLRKLLKKHKVDMLHSHLPQCNFVARLAVPGNIPLVTTIHTSIATAIDYKKWYIRLLDKVTYKYTASAIIAVSNGALKDYFSVLHLKPHKTFVLYTFVDTEQYKVQPVSARGENFRIIAVGALRKGKNYAYLVEAFKKLHDPKVELHIYGNGPEKDNLQQAIDAAKIPVVLKGQVSNIHEVLAKYDLFVMPSMFEGFSLSVLEAMAMQMPMMLSDIPSFKEQCTDTAIYFDLNNTDDFVNKFTKIVADKNLRDELALAAKQRVVNNFTLEHHMVGLKKIYTEVLNHN